MEINNIEVEHYEVINPKKKIIKLSIETIEQVVCRYFKINPIILFDTARKRSVVEYRQTFHYLCKLYTKDSLRKIGDYRKSGYHHATVLNSFNKIQNMVDTEVYWKETINELRDKLNTIRIRTEAKSNPFIALLKEIARDVLICNDNKELNTCLLKYIVRDYN